MLPMAAPATLPGFGGSGTDCMRFRKKMSERFPPGRDTRGATARACEASLTYRNSINDTNPICR
jgi:hypothetical protein